MTSDDRPCAVSVVIPVFNPGRALGDQLEALAGQSGFEEPWEVVLADNGCTDGSLQSALDHERPELDLRVIDATARRGPAHARNRGAAEARGDWIAFCDSDDVVAPNWLAELWQARHGGGLVTGPCDVTLLNEPALQLARGGPEYGATLLDGPCEFLPFAPSCNLFVSRETFERLGGWDEGLAYCEDVDFSWRAQLRGTRLHFADEAVVHYRYRKSVWGVFTQMRRYKAAEVRLYLRYRSSGARRAGPGEALGQYWWIVSRGPYLVLGLRRRMLWGAVAGTIVGRAQGSLRHRVLYL